MDAENPYAAPSVEAIAADSTPTRYREAGAGARLANYFLDQIAIRALLFLIGYVGGALKVLHSDSFGMWSGILLACGITLAYYTICEGLTGRTFGKLITGTRVLTTSDTRPSWSQAFCRSLVRFIPFEPFSIFGQGLWHDRFCDTIVVKTRGKDAVMPDLPVIHGLPGKRPPIPGSPVAPPPINPE